MKYIATNIKVLREEARLSYEDLNEITNIDINRLKMIEKGKIVPTTEEVELLCKPLRIHYEDIIERDILSERNDAGRRMKKSAERRNYNWYLGDKKVLALYLSYFLVSLIGLIGITFLSKFLNIDLFINMNPEAPLLPTTPVVLAATDINDAVTLNAFLERAVSAAKSLTGGHTVSMDPTERKPLKPVSDSAELILPEKKKAEPLPRHFAPVVPAEELLPEIVEQKSEIPAEPMIEKPLVPSVEIPAEPIIETPVVPSVEIPAEPMIETPVVPSVEIPAEPMIETEMDLTEEAVCSALFSAAFPGENEKAFFQKITGKTVHWKGTLKSVYPYSSDFVFGKGPGTKATFEIAEVASGYGMKNKIKATVSFSADTIAQLKGNSGKTFSFSGTLLKFEPFAREILVEKGTLGS